MMEIDRAESGAKILASTVRQFKDSLGEALDLKRKEKDRAGIKSALTDAAIHLIELRRLSRKFFLDEDRVRSETDAAKAPLDQSILQLNNLLYEKNHYRIEIQSCREFRTKFPGIELQTEEQFWEAASEEQKGDAALKENLHQMQLARLQFELAQVRSQLLLVWMCGGG